MIDCLCRQQTRGASSCTFVSSNTIYENHLGPSLRRLIPVSSTASPLLALLVLSLQHSIRGNSQCFEHISHVGQELYITLLVLPVWIPMPILPSSQWPPVSPSSLQTRTHHRAAHHGQCPSLHFHLDPLLRICCFPVLPFTRSPPHHRPNLHSQCPVATNLVNVHLSHLPFSTSTYSRSKEW